MNYPLAARAALSLLCSVQAIATLAIDFNKTHATNPAWTGHARFHVVWQSCTVFLLTGVELFLIWAQVPLATQRFFLAALLAALSPLAFLAAWGFHKAYGGTLSDPNGIAPVRVRFCGAVRTIDLNVAAVVVALLSLWMLLDLFRA